MSKGRIIALIIVMLTIVVLLFNKGNVDVHLVVTHRDFLKSLTFLSFTTIGVIVGILLK